MLAGLAGCGSSGSGSGNNSGTSGGTSNGAASSLGNSGANNGGSDASSAGNAGAGGTSSGGSSAGQAGSASGGTAAGGSAGAGGGSAGGGDVTLQPRDFPYCDYGNVPSATPPAPWDDNPTLTPLGVNPFGAPALTIPVGYILLNEGPQGTTQVPQDTQSSILQRINDDLKFELSYSYLHLPPWTTGAKGGTHYIDYMFVATGFPKDPNAGGDQGTEQQYPDVETTSVAMTDQSQRFDLTHEFNHVLQSSYGTFPGNRISWLHESYNDYLIMLTAEHAAGVTPGQSAQFTLPNNISYLDVLTYQQNYAPIESCGIAVKDGSMVNGPADFPTDITGFRYNDLFPLFIAQRVGQHFFADVWEQANGKEQVLAVMTRLLDQARVSCMVGEYSARLALGDFGEFSTSIQKIARDPAMYTALTMQNGSYSPSNTTWLPRYTGRNMIPITVASGATEVSVDFTPDAAGSAGSPEQMQIELVYRATDGSAVFGQPVTTGNATVSLSKPPKNNVVIAVITNITFSGYKNAQSYGWDPNETFGYTLQITGGTPAPVTKTYF
ncbi:MAG TPA: DUF6055 domain-containing protein [Polyangiaceae bacterium]